MKNFKKAGLAILLVVTVNTASSQPVVTGMLGGTTIGNPDCGAWTRKNTEIQRTWVLGYVSGISAMLVNQKDPIAKIKSAEQVFAYVDIYCKANPLRDVSAAALALAVDLNKN